MKDKILHGFISVDMNYEFLGGLIFRLPKTYSGFFLWRNSPLPIESLFNMVKKLYCELKEEKIDIFLKLNLSSPFNRKEGKLYSCTNKNEYHFNV